jgi:pSer/pThr/pTyr-binding forkhead associated (FHA) protein/ribosomal protein L37E
VIICPKCTKENQDHYKFCLGCGAELPRDASPKKFGPSNNTPPQGVPAVKVAAPIVEESTSQGVASTAAAAPDGQVLCPQCGHSNAPTNKFCASCGFKLAKAAASAAPAAPAAAPAAAPSAPAAAASAAGAPSLGVELPAPQAGGVTLTALRADGTEAGSFHMSGGPNIIGRDSGGIFAGDSYLSPKHATFTVRGRQVVVRDESSLNGVYRKIGRDEPIELAFGDIFRIGQEILRVEALQPAPKTADGVERLGSPAKGYVARLALLIGRDTTGNAYPIPEAGIHLGRERGDVLFPEDGYVSGLHCRINLTGNKIFVTDLGSSNGSFVRLQRDAVLNSGDILLMGQQLFRVAVH